MATEAEYILAIRDALRGELGGSRAATKMIMRWTGTCDRTARNWLSGAAGPSGYHLVRLARESDAVLGIVLTLSGRPELSLSTDIHAVEVALAKASGALERLKRQQFRQQRFR
ncbi:hypothetical protein [Sphingosinicella sp. BN140058]|uniref:hypothetical protein n=1 Tax=Sphingosinicella sp. BN140058 TaxID=1892855 RepID=UPI0010104B16|nr:hypothetical protein [Sphingosinicella sp. BN140058]QAY78080.1 hypothetical protein ETR14_17285 [Sphingosinicella sp. BN140058]